MNLDQAASAVGATVVCLTTPISLTIGKISEIVDGWVIVSMDAVIVTSKPHRIPLSRMAGAFMPHELVFYYGPLTAQLARNAAYGKGPATVQPAVRPTGGRCVFLRTDCLSRFPGDHEDCAPVV